MTQEQPRKFCANCKWAYDYDFDMKYLKCSNPNRKIYDKGVTNPVTGESKERQSTMCEFVLVECNHRWWEPKPPKPTIRRGIQLVFQRIKKWVMNDTNQIKR